MTNPARSLLRPVLGLLLALGLAQAPLRAQLDPRLQTSKTDLLDLYQPNNNPNKAKPEVVMVLDSTGSMLTLSNHRDYPSLGDDGELAKYPNRTDRMEMQVLLIPKGLDEAGVPRYDAQGFLAARARSDVTPGYSPGVGLTDLHLAHDIQATDTPSTLEFNSSVWFSGDPSKIKLIIGGEAFGFTGRASRGDGFGANLNCILTGVTRAQCGTRAEDHAANSPISIFCPNLDWDLPLMFGKLVRPDGTLLAFTSLDDHTEASGDIAIKNHYQAVDPYDVSYPTCPGEVDGLPWPAQTGNPQADARNWMRCASHVRFTFNGKTFDIPIGWTALGPSTLTEDPDNRQYITQHMTYPLRLTFREPVTRTEIEVDSTGRRALRGGGGVCGAGSNSAVISPVYLDWIWNQSTTVPQATSPSGYAFANGLPALSRIQSVKYAVASIWGKYFDQAFIAFRTLAETPFSFLGPQGEDSLSNDSRSYPRLELINTSPVTKLTLLAGMGGEGPTPLHESVRSALAQILDPNSVFNDVETSADAPLECRKTFLVVMTDGQPSTFKVQGFIPSSQADWDFAISLAYSTVSPYYDPNTMVGSAEQGNTAVAANLSNHCLSPGVILNGQTNGWFNLLNFAAVAAHGADPGLSARIPVPPSYPASGTVSRGVDAILPFLPFALTQRGSPALTFQQPHLITTMTVAMCLGQANWNGSTPGPLLPTDAKFRLLATAAMGDPDTTSWNLNTITPFKLAVPGDPSQGKAPNSCYFFDAYDSDSLSKSLDYAIASAIAVSNVNATASPNLPFVGASFGQQVYLGTFKPLTKVGPLWPGDLMMFGTKEINGNVSFIDKQGNVATNLDKTTAQWAASDALYQGPLWSARKLWTRLPGTDTLTAFTDQGSAYETGVRNHVGIAHLEQGSDAQKALIQYAAGGDLTGTLDRDGRPTKNRMDIMGDVINSIPAALEYNWNDVKNSLGAYPRLAAVGGNRFRMILVGTNQGWLHAFGEVTKQEHATVGDPNTPILVKGDVEELWSFMPTDFLAHLDYISHSVSPHRFMVDGSPAIYHLDLPPSGGGLANGVVDIANPKERALAVIGLRKGGRSYYALDIRNPFSPALQWFLVPDEADQFPATRILAGGTTLAEVKALLKTGGFSSSTPAIGRVQFSGVIRDAVFLGGGASAPEVEANFEGVPHLGRSVLAVDAWSGAVLAAADLTDAAVGGPSVGPVATGLVPFEYILGSGMAQRAYFLDYKGGLWAWGAKEVAAAAPYTDFRVDTSELSTWKLRKVYQDSNSGLGARYTTLPAPFRVANFLGVGKPGSAAPAAVGVAMVSGDRNNPLDYLYSEVNSAPDHHRLTVVFDRQDSRAWGLDTATGPDPGITDANLANFTANIIGSTPADPCVDAIFKQITPGCPDYYLAPHSTGASPSPLPPQFGYYVNFPSASGGFIPKGINPPLVVAGSLYYSYFNPTYANRCGSSGNTLSGLITDVLNPLVVDTRDGSLLRSGQTNKDLPWQGVASDYLAFGTKAVLQGGTVATVGSGTAEEGRLSVVRTTQTLPGNRYAKPKVWRTVH